MNSSPKKQWTIIGIGAFLFVCCVYFDWIGKLADHFAPPLVPVHFSNQGNVAILKCTSDHAISITAKFTNPTFNKVKRLDLILEPNEEKQILQWDLVTGDQVELASDGYRKLILTIGRIYR